MARRARAPKHYMRCRACHSLTPTKYTTCSACGGDPARAVVVVNTLDELKREFERARLEQLAEIGASS